MRSLSLFLKAVAPIFLLVALLHLVFGLGADAMLGARLSAEQLADPALDSQNRFYGASFGLYGVLTFLCATDLSRYRTVLHCVLGGVFAGGLARLLSLALHGSPPPMILLLLGAELLLPPLVVLWIAKAKTP